MRGVGHLEGTKRLQKRLRTKEEVMMKRGVLTKRRHLTDFKGIVIGSAGYFSDEYGENEIKLWKVLWFEHPFGSSPEVETIDERHLEKY